LVAALGIGSAVELIYAFPSADSFVRQGRPGGGTLLSELDNLDFTPAMRLWTASSCGDSATPQDDSGIGRWSG
jgi:hypothetical protein